MSYALGVDGGATKTLALLMDETCQAMGFGQAGPSNHQTCGMKGAMQEIERASRSACDELGLSSDDVEVGYFCLAGADLPEDYVMLQEALENLSLSQSVIVRNDSMAALRAGLKRSWGIVVICGTGFNAAGRAPDGQEIQLLGLGPISGDWGGGGHLAQEMIRFVMRAWDGRGKNTLLTDLVLEAVGAPSIEDLISRLYHEEIDQQQINNLVPLLFEAAEMGDEVARELIVQMGTEVGVTAKTLITRLSLQEKDVEVVLGGSVFKGKGSLFLDTIAQVVREEAPRAQIVRPRYEPVVGAALLAIESLGLTITEQFYPQLENLLPPDLLANGGEIGPATKSSTI